MHLHLQHLALKHVSFKPFRCDICLQGYYCIEVNHPTVNPRKSNYIFLSPSQSLDYLNISKSIVCNFPSLSSISGIQYTFSTSPIPSPINSDQDEQQYSPLNQMFGLYEDLRQTPYQTQNAISDERPTRNMIIQHNGLN